MHSQFLSVGQKYRNFKVVKVVEIPELQCVLRELLHEPTSAQVMHIKNDDPENVFCLSLRTIPDSSNGAAHILEHTVLCGSEKFPVKDPFFLMHRRSLNTFMNALTGADFTCYPAASQVPKDFYNLLEVYLDAVFKPKLNELSFFQEGHRLEFAIPLDPNSPLQRKGIVLNEMKGALSSPTTRLAEAMHASLFPNVTYGFNSGGDPKVIPELTYSQLREFHQKYYHPSRCLFFFYGNMPLEGHLDFLEKHALKDVEKLPPLAAIPKQPRFSAPVCKTSSYPISSEEEMAENTFIAMGWLTCHILEQQELLALAVITIALMDTDASPLKMALLKSGLCKQVTVSFDDEINEVPIVFVLKGCRSQAADELEKLTKKTLAEIAEEGIPSQLIENAMHQLEFHRSEITGDHAPFGLSLFMRSALLKQHGGNAEDGLKIHSLFDQLYARLSAEPRCLEQLIKKHFLQNPHFTKVVMVPEKELAAKEQAEETAILEKLRRDLTEKQVQSILEKTKQLIDLQAKQREENLDVLPKVTIADIPKQSRDFPITKEKVGNLELFHHECFTNNIVYADLVYYLPNLSEEDLPFVSLFATLLPQVGCGGRDYKQNLEYLQANTGGIGAAMSLNLQVQNNQQYTPSFHVRSKALYRKVDRLFPLLLDVASSLDFKDLARLREIILKHHTALQNSLTQNALRYAMSLSASHLSIPSKIINKWYGLEYYEKIRELAQNFDAQAPLLISKMEELKSKLLCLENPHLILTCDKEMAQHLKEKDFYGIANLRETSFVPWKGKYSLAPIESQGRVIPSSVAFTSRVFPTVSYLHPDSPALSLVPFLFDNLVLHTRIREQGGAYGGGAARNAISGNFSFHSYRDPNVATTFQAFEEAINTVLEENIEEQDLEEAKLEIIQGLDAPVAPGSRGELAYSWWRAGKTLQVRQAFRERLLNIQRDDVISAVKTHIVPNMEKGAAAVFASQELLEKENQALKKLGKKPLKINAL